MTTHSELSPSARHRWGVCAQAPRQEARYPEQPSGPAAIDGTHSHTLLEACLTKGVSPSEFIGEELHDHEGKFVVDMERAERVEVALRYITERQLELGRSCVTHAETKCDPGSLFGRDDLKGTSDAVLISDSVIEVIDYKDGLAPVEAKDNPQMDQYMWGIIAGLSEGGKKDVPQTTVRMTIIQPKLLTKGMPAVSSHEMPLAEFAKGRQLLADQAAATDDPNAPFNPGEKQCKYCRHKGACTALANQMMEASGISFENLDVAKDAAGKDPHTLTNDQIRELVEAAPLLRQLLEAAEAEALRRFESGTNIDGLKVVRGRGSRTWLLSEEETAERLKKMGLPKEAIWKTTLISPAQAEKVRWTKRDGTQKQLSERQLKLMADEYIKKSDGKLTVVSSADDHPAVELNAASMFNAVEVLPSWLS